MTFSCSSSDSNSITNLTVVTNDVSSVTSSSALGGGNVFFEGGGTVTSRGLVWSLYKNPNIADAKSTDGSGKGSFVTNINGLTPNTTYHIRAYAINNETPTYGNEVIFTTTEKMFANCGNVTDIDSNVYPSVTIGTQCWMQKNLDVQHYSNGDPIPQITDSVLWKNLTTGAWCYYENNTENGVVYGKLYNWYAVNDPRGLAPEGWRVSTNSDWTILTSYLYTDVGNQLKFNTGWNSNFFATNSSGFRGLPGGMRQNSYTIPPSGGYIYIGERGNWWNSTEKNNQYAYSSFLGYDSSDVIYNSYPKTYGLSVRCVKN